MGQTESLRNMGLAALAFVGVAILSVLGIIVLNQFKEIQKANPETGINTTIDAWIAAVVIFGTFATIIALVIVTKVIIDIVKQLQT